MASPMACVGLGVDDAALTPLLTSIAKLAVPVGEANGYRVLRWQDASGARLVLDVRGQGIVNVLPSYAGEATVQLGGLRPANEDVALTDVFDEDGHHVTVIAVELEERQLLAARRAPVSGRATVVALAMDDVEVHADEDAFGASPASLLREDDDAEPPLRFGAESLISFGAFRDGADAYARMAGVVTRAERRRNTYTGQDFVAALVRTAGFDATVCLAASEHDVPAPGNVVAGRVLLVASMDLGPEPAATRGRWFRRR